MNCQPESTTAMKDTDPGATGQPARAVAPVGASAPPRGVGASGSQSPVIQRRKHGYQRLSRFYDLLAVPWLTNGVRREAVSRLRLRPGDSAIDLGCGTGLNFPMLVKAVGPTGRVVVVDLSPDQLGQAAQRVDENGWSNVFLVAANAEELDLGEEFQGIISSYTHDIMTSSLAVELAAGHLRPGGRFVALGFVGPPVGALR